MRPLLSPTRQTASEAGCGMLRRSRARVTLWLLIQASSSGTLACVLLPAPALPAELVLPPLCLGQTGAMSDYMHATPAVQQCTCMRLACDTIYDQYASPTLPHTTNLASFIVAMY